MKRIRKKERVDRLMSEKRGKKGSIGRWIYLILVTLLLLWLADVFLGKYIVFRADGMITRDQIVRSVSYPADVSEILVKEGDEVEAGQLLAQLYSTRIMEQLAELDAEMADLKVNYAETNSRTSQIDNITPMAKARTDKMKKLIETEENAIARGITSTSKMSQYLEDEFDARERLALLKAEREELPVVLDTISGIITNLEESRAGLVKAFGGGRIVANQDATVSKVLVTEGSAVNIADPILELLVGESYILAYMTPGSFDKIEVGHSVKVLWGVDSAQGTVTALLPISARLPLEFQRTFRPQERSQVLRIDFDSEQNLPASFTKVTVVSTGVAPKWIMGIFTDFIRWFWSIDLSSSRNTE